VTYSNCIVEFVRLGQTMNADYALSLWIDLSIERQICWIELIKRNSRNCHAQITEGIASTAWLAQNNTNVRFFVLTETKQMIKGIKNLIEITWISCKFDTSVIDRKLWWMWSFLSSFNDKSSEIISLVASMAGFGFVLHVKLNSDHFLSF